MGNLYRAVWRWHFYAGLLTLPFLVWLAVTGSLYLYKPEIEAALYSRWTHVVPQARPLPLSTLTERIAEQSGGKVLQIAAARAPDESWRMTLLHRGEKRTAFVDPYRGTLLGTTGQGGIMQTVRDLHSLAITGPVGNALVEIAAGWAIILVLTGIYLWWPRAGSPVVGVRGAPARRPFWRDLHASTGLIAGAVILFLALTGMPWSGVWGGALQSYIGANGLGRPMPPSSAPAGHHEEAARTLPWSMQHAAAPAATGAGDIGPDRALAVARAQGLAAPWTMTLPATPGAPYLVSAAIVRAEDAHVLYIAADTGAVLQDAPYASFGPAARAIEWGIAVHQGQEYGEANRLLMLAACLSLILLAVSAAVMWWKRRPAGRLAAPPRPLKQARGLLAIMLAIGALFPLTGATMVVALAGDLAVRRLGIGRT